MEASGSSVVSQRLWQCLIAVINTSSSADLLLSKLLFEHLLLEIFFSS